MTTSETMTTTWVVVAHQTGARFMEHRPGFGKNLTLVRELANPDGRKKNHELESDRAGDSFTGTRASGGRRAMSHEHTAHEHVSEVFARQIAAEVEHARIEGRFGALILVASPKLLGLLRDALSPTTARLVVDSMHKDLAAVPARDLAEHIASVLPL